MQAFQDDIARFAELNAQVLGVSSDSLETHREFAAKLGLDFPLIADDGTIRKLYGGGRITYLIDQSGIIRYVHKGMPDNETLVGEISALSTH
jgi:peroxiredoxin Q/BCP